MIYSRIFSRDILQSVTDITGMHTLLDSWTRYHDKILLESARLSIETLADSHIVTLIVTVTLRVAH